MNKFGIFFRCVGEAFVAKGLRGLMGLIPLGKELAEVAADAFKRIQDRKVLSDMRVEMESMAQASIEEVKIEAWAAVEQVAAERTPEEKQALVNYLTQIPACLRRTMRRPEDAAGRTIPAHFRFGAATDLMAILPPTSPRLKSGDSVPGMDEWQLDEMLGSGGFGEVWKARHRSFDGTSAAFKFCLDPDARQRLLAHEASILNQVMKQGRHPGIVPLLDARLNADPPWLRYELIEGGDLTTLFRAWSDLPADERQRRVRLAILQLCEIVGHFHELQPAVVHRDLKPANVLVQFVNGEAVLRVADFGIGDISASTLLLATPGSTMQASLGQTLRGAHTPLYASPQQRRGEPGDVRDDVHAIGVIWYQLMMGDPTLSAPTGLRWPEELKRRGVSADAIALLAACLEPDAADRPANASAIADAIRAWSTPKSVPPDAIPNPENGVGSGNHTRGIRWQIFAAQMHALNDYYNSRPSNWLWVTLAGALVIPIITVQSRDWTFFAMVPAIGILMIASVLMFLVKTTQRRRGIPNLIAQIEMEFADQLQRYGTPAMLRDPVAMREILRRLPRR